METAKTKDGGGLKGISMMPDMTKEKLRNQTFIVLSAPPFHI